MQAACNSQKFSCTVRIYWSLKFLLIITTVILNLAMMKEHFVLRTTLKNQYQQRGLGGDTMNSGAELRYNIINPHT